MPKGTRILIIDFTNYEDYPIGGYLSFARSLMEAFGSDLALSGITTSVKDPVGKWFKKEIEGTEYDFFAMARYTNSKTMHVIPDRLANYLLFRYYHKEISKIKINNLFIQRQELLIAIPKSTYNICFCFAGLENPLSISKYWYAHPFSGKFESTFFKRLGYVNTILASGNDNEIREMITRSKDNVSISSVIKFPTRINTGIFKPINKIDARKKLGLPADGIIVITTGRLAPLKGWKFMIDSYCLFKKEINNSKFYFIGEGEDYDRIKAYISDLKLHNEVILEGRKSSDEVALFLNASDLFIMASQKEGWSTSLMEAIACGVPACVTNFSSADDIILSGKNGYIIHDRNENNFVKGMVRALSLPRPVENESVLRFATSRLKEDLLKYWKLT